MIRSLQIHNFQSHKDTILEFSDGVNVIIGQSDSGKTAIIRALRWLVWGRPLGDSIRSNWGGETKVFVSIKEGDVTKMRGATGAKYKIGEDIYEASGTEVPSVVTDMIGINEINLQQQLDSPFLLSDSPGEVATHFNQVAHLEKIDNGLKNIQGWIRQLEGDIKNIEQYIERKSEELKQFDHLDKFEAEIEALEQMQGVLLSRIHGSTILSDIISKLNPILPAKQALQQTISGERVLSLILDNKAKIKEKNRDFWGLENLTTEIKDNRTNINDLKKLTVLEKPVSFLFSLIDKREQLEVSFNSLSQWYSTIENLHFAANDLQQNLKGMEETFHQEMPDVCPLCDQPIKKYGTRKTT